MPPASPGSYPRSASQFDPGSFLIPASALVSQSMRDFVCALYDQSLFPIATWLSHMQALEEFKARYSGVHHPRAEPPGWASQCWAQTPHSLRKTFTIGITLPFVGHPPPRCGLDYSVSVLSTDLIVNPSLYL